MSNKHKSNRSILATDTHSQNIFITNAGLSSGQLHHSNIHIFRLSVGCSRPFRIARRIDYKWPYLALCGSEGVLWMCVLPV